VIGHLLLKGRVAILIKICGLLLRVYYRASAMQLGGGLREERAWTAQPSSPPGTAGQDLDDSKEAERPVVDQVLPIASTPGAKGGVNYGNGSQAAKDAREQKPASRRVE
jgi:hypothetical protein